MRVFTTDGCGNCPFLYVDIDDDWACSLGSPLRGNPGLIGKIDPPIVQDGLAFPDDCPLPVTIEKAKKEPTNER